MTNKNNSQNNNQSESLPQYYNQSATHVAVTNENVSVTKDVNLEGKESTTVKGSSIKAGGGINIGGGAIRISGGSIICGGNVKITGGSINLNGASITSTGDFSLTADNLNINNDVSLEANNLAVTAKQLELADESNLNVTASEYYENVDSKKLGHNASINISKKN